MTAFRYAFCLACLTAWALSTCLVSGAPQNKTRVEKSNVVPPEPRVDRTYPKTAPVLELKGHSDWINRVVYTPDGKFLVTAGRDKTLRVWDIATGKEVLKIANLPAPAVAMAVSPDGTKLATTAGKWIKDKQQWIGEVNLYDIKTGKLSSTVKGHTESIEAVAFHPQGKMLVTASKDATAKVWDVASGKEIATYKGHTGPVIAVVCSADGKWVATGGDDNTVRIWEPSTGKEVKTLKGPKRKVPGLAFSNDGSLLAAASWDETVTVWKTADWSSVHVLKAEDGVLSVAFSPDGSKLACGGWEHVVQIWDVKTGKELGGMAGHTQSISCVVFNAAGDRVVSASLDNTVRVWNVTAAKPGVENKKKDQKKAEEKKK